MRNRFSKATIAFAATLLISLAAVAVAQIDIDKAKKLNIGFGKVEGTVTLPQGANISCSQVRVGLQRFVQGDPIGTQTAGPVTPTSSGPGQCSYSLTALATGWNVTVGHSSPYQFTLSYQVTPSQGVAVQKGQTAIRNIKITAVKPFEPPH